MRASVAVAQIRELLKNSTSWSELELARYLNRHVHSLLRRMVELDEAYSNYVFTLLKGDARQLHTGQWEWTLPPWCMRVLEVRDIQDPTAPAGQGLGPVFSFVRKYETAGIVYSGTERLQLKGFTDARNLEITCAKLPALLTKGTLPVQTNLPTPTDEHMRIDADTSADALNYPHETEPDSYANAQFEISGNTARSGQRRRCIGSTHFQDEGGTLYTVLRFDRAWTTQPLAGDTYEMHVEIPDQHMQIVLLLAAHTAWGTRGHYDEQKAMAPLIAEQLLEFTRQIRPRQLAHPEYLRHSILPPYAGIERSEDTRYQLWT